MAPDNGAITVPAPPRRPSPLRAEGRKSGVRGNLHVRWPIHLETVSPVHCRSNSGICAGQNAQKIKVAHYPLAQSHCVGRPLPLELFRSRDSPFLSSFPLISQADAALCVQNTVVIHMGTPYIVFSCLTWAGFRRYISCNLCLLDPAWAGICAA